MNRIDIVGGGLAGLSLGIALRGREIPVRVWEAGQYPRHRVCGEFISGVERETLEKIGIGDLFFDAPKLQSATWWLGNRHLFDVALPTPAMGLSRFAIDVRLANRFKELGGDLRVGERFRTDDPVTPGLVWAAGRTAAKSNLLGLTLHARDFELQADLEMHFAPGGYAGLCRVEDGRVNISALFHRNLAVKAERRELFLAYLTSCGLSELVERIQRSRVDPESHAAVSSVPCGFCRGSGDGEPCSIGDYFGSMGPFTGNGISHAFESAAAASDPLVSYAAGEVSWMEAKRTTLTTLRERFGRKLRVSRALHQILLNRLGLHGMAVLGKVGALPFNFLYHQVR